MTIFEVEIVFIRETRVATVKTFGDVAKRSLPNLCVLPIDCPMFVRAFEYVIHGPTGE